MSDNVSHLPILSAAERASRMHMAKATIIEAAMEERWTEIPAIVAEVMRDLRPSASPQERLRNWHTIRADVDRRIAVLLDQPPEEPMSRVSTYYGPVSVRSGKLRIVDAEADGADRGVVIEVDPARRSYSIYDLPAVDFGGGRVAVTVAITEAEPTAAMRTAYERRTK